MPSPGGPRQAPSFAERHAPDLRIVSVPPNVRPSRRFRPMLLDRWSPNLLVSSRHIGLTRAGGIGNHSSLFGVTSPCSDHLVGLRCWTHASRGASGCHRALTSLP